MREPDLHPVPGGRSVPERRLSPEELEAVIRRATQLQEGTGDQDGLSEGELVRMGADLGLSPIHLQQAIAELRAGAGAERDLLSRAFGPSYLTASRTLVGAADRTRADLERYLVEDEFFVVCRRFADRTSYERGTGFIASIGRAANQLSRRGPRLDLRTLEVAVQPLEEGFCHVTLSTDLSGARGGIAAGAAAAGVGGGGAAALALAIAVAPPAALLGLPILAATVFGMRKAYVAMAERSRTQLESLLDRVQHHELPPPRAPRQRLLP